MTDETIQKIKDANDIVDVISEDIELKKVGNKYEGLCPFHKEDSPSFKVYPDTQSFYCFGCGAGKRSGSDVIAYIMKKKQLEWDDAIAYLVKRANMTISERPDPSARFYTKNVVFSRECYVELYANQDVLAYLYNRGLSDDDISTWRIGYSQSDSFFKNRIIFPVLDLKKRSTGFTSRKFPDELSIPKCLHSPLSNIFKRNSTLYGLVEALPYIKSSKEVFVVEGPLDVISLHKIGFKNTVGTLGCEISDEQLDLLVRLGVRIIMAYDGDKAGIKASKSACDKLIARGIDSYICLFPNNYDPNDLMLEEDDMDSAMQIVRENTFEYCSYKMRQYIQFYDSMVMHAKKEFYSQVETFTTSIPEGSLKLAVQSFIEDRVKGGV